jgi:bifunctional DNase/RNase
MVALSVLGLQWCQHVGWMVVLYDASRGRRLQVAVPAEDAVVVGRELAQQPSARSGLYTLVGALLRRRPDLASITFALTGESRACARLVVRGADGSTTYPTSAADGVALAVRAGLPIYAEEALLAAYGIEDAPEAAAPADDAPGASPIPPAFRRALGGADASEPD